MMGTPWLRELAGQPQALQPCGEPQALPPADMLPPWLSAAVLAAFLPAQSIFCTYHCRWHYSSTAV